MEKQVNYAFPTPIGQCRLTDVEAAELNDELRRIILERERTEAGENHSNAGGWHSKADLLEWPDGAVAILRDRLHEAVDHVLTCASRMLQSTRGPTPDCKFSFVISAWANVNRRGDYNRVHNHPCSCWSGVYYVSPGSDAADHPLSGLLELMDPRPFTEMIPVPGEPFGQRLIIRPATGMFIVFPSWIYHFANPYHGDGERISIAFNVSPVGGLTLRRLG